MAKKTDTTASEEVVKSPEQLAREFAKDHLKKNDVVIVAGDHIYLGLKGAVEVLAANPTAIVVKGQELIDQNKEK